MLFCLMTSVFKNVFLIRKRDTKSSDKQIQGFSVMCATEIIGYNALLTSRSVGPIS